VRRLIDSHAHLTFDALAGQVEAVLRRAADAGVGHVVTVGTDLADSRRAVALAAAHPNVSATVGIHPHEAAKATEADLAAVIELAASPGVVALGETGLDYHYDFSDRASQRRVFEAQLAAAAARGLPVILHCREAFTDTVSMLTAGGFDSRPVVFHCFGGTQREADVIAGHGWWISFTGILTFKNVGELREVARTFPPDRMMLETDCPYLSPEPVRHIRTNEPAHLAHIARFLADLRGEPVEELADRISANTRGFFGLP